MHSQSPGSGGTGTEAEKTKMAHGIFPTGWVNNGGGGVPAA